MKERPKQGRHKSTDQLGITYHYLMECFIVKMARPLKVKMVIGSGGLTGRGIEKMALLVNGRMAPRSGFSKEFNTLKRNSTNGLLRRI